MGFNSGFKGLMKLHAVHMMVSCFIVLLDLTFKGWGVDPMRIMSI